MPVPVIATDTGVLEGLQWAPFVYQPYATNLPTSWAWYNLPAGLDFDTVTGKITGNPTEFGTFVPYAIATNGSGAGTDQKFPMRFEESPAALNSPGYEAKFDLITKQVKLVGGADLLVYAAYNDDIIIYLYITKGEAYLDLPLTDMKLVIKENDVESTLITSDSWGQDGAGSGTVYKLHAKVTGSKARATVSNYEKKVNTSASVQAELQLTMTNPDYDGGGDGFGPATFTISSKRFPIIIGSEYVPNV